MRVWSVAPALRIVQAMLSSFGQEIVVVLQYSYTSRNMGALRGISSGRGATECEKRLCPRLQSNNEVISYAVFGQSPA